MGLVNGALEKQILSGGLLMGWIYPAFFALTEQSVRAMSL